MGRLPATILTARANGRRHTSANKENIAPAPPRQSVRRADGLQAKLLSAERQILQQKEQIDKLSTERASAVRKANRWKSEAAAARAAVPDVDPRILAALDAVSSKADRLQKHLDASRVDRSRLQMARDRAHAKLANSVSPRTVARRIRAAKTLVLKDSSGAIPYNVSDLIRNLVCHCNVSVRNCFLVVRFVAEAFGLELSGSFGKTAVSDALREIIVIGNCQLVDSLTTAKGVTMMTDGTTDRNQHYQGAHMSVKHVDDSCESLFLSLHRQHSHTAEQQAEDLDKDMDQALQIYADSPLALERPVEKRDWMTLWVGVNSDHASEMKKTSEVCKEKVQRFDRITRGHDALNELPDEEYIRIGDETYSYLIECAGGYDSWVALDTAEQEKRFSEAMDTVAYRIGLDCFNALPPWQRESIDLWVWTGCCMHKEMNIVVAGTGRMAEYWPSVGLEGPIIQPNKDNAAAIALGESAAQERALAISPSGGAVLAAGCGALVRHKEAKRGYQRTWNNFTLEHEGHNLEYPDTNRNRFQAVCEGSRIIIVDWKTFVDFMGLIYHKKKTPGFTNFEQNIYDALFDDATLTECAALALCAQCATKIYVAMARAAANAIDLRDLHYRLLAHLRFLAENSSTVVDTSPTESYVTCALDGQPYMDVELFYAVQYRRQSGLLGQLPGVFTALMTGAADKLEASFMTEYAPDSPIARAHPYDLDRLFMPPTNDRSESILAFMRRTHHAQPNIGDDMLNAKAFCKYNNAYRWVSKQPPPVREYIRSAARKLDLAARSREYALAEVAHLRSEAARNADRIVRKQAELDERTKRLDEYEPRRIRDPDDVHMKMDKAVLELELEWHRYRGLPQGEEHAIHIAKNRLPSLKLKIPALQAAIRELNRVEDEDAAVLDHPPTAPMQLVT
ncbi:hypothetical protein EXIGLDRAFT_782180 [Exidia glandulosa HHB12029]|uniref:Uncharacterized protein n=1 Tax=Exidia glandulosa HHB12029 TaxID=1314781 RepID=A0A165AXZ9_EXIGL|nr:hypothetical protein EXIGLDRAFT_782180 [Exidia glandulosa HHB12029]